MSRVHHTLSDALKNHQTILSLLLLAAFLLVFRISHRAFWMDETAVLYYLKDGPIDFLLNYVRVPDNHPPLYYFSVILSQTILPMTVWAIRSISVLAALGVVWLVYSMGQYLTGKRSLALLAAAFLATHSYAVLHGQMARYHTMAAFFALWAIYCSIRLVREGYTRSLYATFLATGILTAYADYPHFFYLVALINMYMMWSWWGNKAVIAMREWVLSQVVWAVGAMPLVWLVIHRIVVQGDGGFDKESLLGSSPIRYGARFGMHIYVYFFGENMLPWRAWPIFIIGCAVLMYLCYRLIVLFYQRNTAAILLAFFSFGAMTLNTVFLSIVNPRFNFIVYPKYGYVAFPLFALLMAVCIMTDTTQWRRRLVVGSVLLINLYGLSVFYDRSAYVNASYFNSFAPFVYLEEHKEPGDVLLTNGDANPGLFAFFKDSFFSELRAVPATELADGRIVPDSGERYWMFLTGRDDVDGTVSPESRIPDGLRIVDELYTTPLDPTLILLKERVLGRPSYVYKNALFLLEQE